MNGTRTQLLVAQVAFVIVAVVGVVGFGAMVRDAEHRRAPEAVVSILSPSYSGNDRLAPDFELADRSGHRTRLSNLRGRIVVLHFFSRTCLPCVAELQQSLPAFDELVRDRQDMSLMLVSVDNGWNAIAPIVPPGFTAPILFDPQRHVVAEQFGTRLFPETWVIDRRGIIRARFDHTLEWDSPVLIDYLTTL